MMLERGRRGRGERVVDYNVLRTEGLHDVCLCVKPQRIVVGPRRTGQTPRYNYTDYSTNGRLSESSIQKTGSLPGANLRSG
jgi:hypothetical protein